MLRIRYSLQIWVSLGDGNNKKIATKYRYLHPSMAGILDLNTSSNSDIGLSGSFTPFAKLYDGYYFTPDHEPCQGRYRFEKDLADEGFRKIHGNNFDEYLKYLEKHDKFKELLKYEAIKIVEKET